MAVHMGGSPSLISAADAISAFEQFQAQLNVEAYRWRSSLHRLVAFGGAIVLDADAAPVNDRTFLDRDAVGLRSQWPARGGCQLGADTGGPALSARIAVRWGDPDVARQ